MVLYLHQQDAIDWALEQPEPYLFINAPTGSGKTLINTTVGMKSEQPWTYAVHTIRLQNQVAAQFEDIPVFTGRANFPCLLPLSNNADSALCAMPGYQYGECEHDPSGQDPCGYYLQAMRAMSSPQRVVNYSLLLSYPPLVVHPRSGQVGTKLLLCDEAHNVEEAVCNSVALNLSERTLRRLGIRLPKYTDIMAWAAWARKLVEDGRINQDSGRPDLGFKVLDRTVRALAGVTPDRAGEWLVQSNPYGYSFQPIWGAPFVMEKLLGHREPPPGASLLESAYSGGVRKAVFTSATLMGAEFIADLLGFPSGSWSYLDMPSTFPTANRPVNYSPVDAMNAGKIATVEGRATMQEALDRLIEYYVRGGNPWGIIHAVSNKYRDFILTDSRWRGIMTSSIDEHERKVAEKSPSVLVASNITEGWDGKDDLCRFVLIPKVPYPDLGDARTKLRMQEDPRSYDHRALVAVVQGAGRGVRHKEDYADTWILDSAWRVLLARRGSWLPQSFRDAYKHNVQLPL